MLENSRHIRAGISILYVEDEHDTRAQVTRTLQSRGYSVTTACDGREGLTLFHEVMPDIVLTDIMMPHLNGLTMSRMIRETVPDAIIICMTAFSDTSYMIEAIDIGINQFVLKPVEFTRLFAALERCQETVLLRRHQQLLEAEKQRAHKMEAIAILAGGMAHDFNNLLQVILGYVSLARMNAAPGSKTETMLAIVEKSAESAKVLSSRLLTFAKGGDVFKKPLQLAQLIRPQVEAELGSIEQVNVQFDLPDTLPLVQADADQFQQVITQLTRNAREAMPHGGTLHILVTTEELPDKNDFGIASGSYLHILFSDTGIGIPEENMERIFDPYFSTKDFGSLKGTGLGLALCSSIIKHHNGHIHAESSPGEETRFHLYLPILSADTCAPDEVVVHS
jgi:signal transduction histidine kinase